ELGMVRRRPEHRADLSQEHARSRMAQGWIGIRTDINQPGPRRLKRLFGLLRLGNVGAAVLAETLPRRDRRTATGTGVPESGAAGFAELIRARAHPLAARTNDQSPPRIRASRQYRR